MDGDSGFDDMATVYQVVAPPTPGEHPWIQVIGLNRSERYELPASGEVLIGRAPECAVRIDAPELSRKHARLCIGPTSMTLEDLDSANGTRVGDAKLSPGLPVKVMPGEPVQLGALLIVIQPPRPRSARRRRLLPHGVFQTRLESEFARARGRGAMLAVGRVMAPPVAGLREAFFDAVREDEAVAVYAPDVYEFLFVGITPDDARSRADALAATLATLAPSAMPKVGLALFPHDGMSPEALIQRAGERCRGVTMRALSPQDRIVEAPGMRRLFQLIDRVAKAPVTTLVLGEHGVGKTTVAEALHVASGRSAQPLIRFGGHEPDGERVLFGTDDEGRPGAKAGLLEAADGGTVYVHDVDGLSLAAQDRLLQVLETRKVLRVRGLQPRAVDLRFVFSTSVDIEAEVAVGRFRSDLYARMNCATLTVPPLRARLIEVPKLARMFVRRLSAALGLSAAAIAPSAMTLLCRYDWPGNVAELRSVIERALLIAQGSMIQVDHLPSAIMRSSGPVPAFDHLAADLGGHTPPDDHDRTGDLDKTSAMPPPMDRTASFDSPRDFATGDEVFEPSNAVWLPEHSTGPQSL